MGIWTRTHFQQKGHYLCATTYLVAAGRPKVFQFRVDLRPLEKLAARVHRQLHDKAAERSAVSGEPLIGWSLKKMWKGVKKTAKKIGRSKLIRSVKKATRATVRVTKSVIKSKVTGALGVVLTAFPPTAAVGVGLTSAYLAANAAVKAIESGHRVVKGAMKAKREIESGVRAAKGLAKMTRRRTKKKADPSSKGRKSRRPSFRMSSAARAKLRSATSRMSSAQKRAVARRLAARARAVQLKEKRRIAAKKVQLRLTRKQKASVTAARLRAKRAAALRKKLASAQVRKKLLLAKARAAGAKQKLEAISQKARYGSGIEKLDAQKSAAIINLVARNRARVRAMAETHAGGLPALLIDNRGRLRPGHFRVKPKAPGMDPDVLYMGPQQVSQSGHFTRIAGEIDSWVGGADSFGWDTPPAQIGCADNPDCNC
ncbi:MAG: hypothetical protein ACPG77_03140 [Nannocystaceae bacterium]